MRRIIRPKIEKPPVNILGKIDKEKHGPIRTFVDMTLEEQETMRKNYENNCLPLQHRYAKTTHS